MLEITANTGLSGTRQTWDFFEPRLVGCCLKSVQNLGSADIETNDGLLSVDIVTNSGSFFQLTPWQTVGYFQSTPWQRSGYFQPISRQRLGYSHRRATRITPVLRTSDGWLEIKHKHYFRIFCNSSTKAEHIQNIHVHVCSYTTPTTGHYSQDKRDKEDGNMFRTNLSPGGNFLSEKTDRKTVRHMDRHWLIDSYVQDREEGGIQR